MAHEAGRIAHEVLDVPHIAGHRVSVRRIHALVEERGLAPHSVADRLGVDVADVFRTLAYDHDYPGEMHDIIMLTTARGVDAFLPVGPEPWTT